MRALPIILSAALGLASASAVAQEVPNTQIGEGADPSEGVAGTFRAKMIITPDIDGFWKAWEGPTPPNIVTTRTISTTKPVHAILIFGGCKPAADGKCKVSVTFRMTAPDGSAYGDAASGTAYEGPSGGAALLASNATLGFRLEPKDRLGAYRMIADLTDDVARAKVTINATVLAQAD